MVKNLFRNLLILTVLFSVICSAAETRTVDLIRKKDVLSDEDKQMITTFVGNSVSDIFYTEDFSTVASIRQSIVSRKESSNNNSAQQYDKSFYSAAQKSIADSIKKVDSIENPQRAEVVLINLLVLINELENVNLAALTEDFFDSQSAAVRYLAVNSFANAKVLDELNKVDSANAELGRRIAQKFSKMAEQEPDENIIKAIIAFGRGLKGTDGQKLLLAITKDRIEKYKTWQINNELADYNLLAAVGERAVKALTDEEKSELMANFAQLYSYVIQRYALGEKILSEEQLDSLVDVIAGVEYETISSILGDKTQALKKALERKDMPALLAAHDSLLGSKAGRGSLATAIDFNYGNVDGNVVNEPAKLVLPTLE